MGINRKDLADGALRTITKVCTKCGEEKTLADFPKNKYGKNGRNSQCKVCNNLRIRKYPKKIPYQYTEEELKGKTKVCSICKEEKDLTAYHHSKTGKWNRHSMCNECKRIKNREGRLNKIINTEEDTTVISRVCTKCKKDKPLDEFYNTKYGLYGKLAKCIECCKEDGKLERAKRKKNKPEQYIPKDMQKCTGCKKIKPVSEYHKNSYAVQGISCRCKECVNKKSKTIYYLPDEELQKRTKKCRHCGEVKTLAEFNKNKYSQDTRRGECKLCSAKQEKSYHINPDMITKGYLVCKICKREMHVDNFYKNPSRKSGRRVECKECHRKLSRDYELERYQNSSLFRLKKVARTRISEVFRRKGYTKNSKCTELLGISWEGLKAYLESQFCEGMTWDNFGTNHLPNDVCLDSNTPKWQVDHIIPLSKAKDEETIKELCHYTNLQPLWEDDNRDKGNKLDWVKDPKKYPPKKPPNKT